MGEPDAYCEKPLTFTIADGRRIVQVARQYGTQKKAARLALGA